MARLAAESCDAIKLSGGAFVRSDGHPSLKGRDPRLIWFVKIPMTPVTATFFVAAAVFCFAKLVTGSHPVVSSLCLGAACALGTLDHPALAALTGGFTLAILIVLWSRRAQPSTAPFRLGNALLSIAVMWAAFLVALLPYTIRNYQD